METQSLLDSRKFRQISAGSLAAAATQVIGVVAMIYHWTPEKSDALVRESTNMITLAFTVGGMIAALLTAVEDFARKWGVTAPPPHELAAVAALVGPVTNVRKEGD